MPIVFARMRKLMEEKGITSYTVKRDKIIGQATLKKIKEDGDIDTRTIARMCEVLDCQPGDLMEYVKDSDGYELLTEKESMWAGMLEEVLKDNGVPCVSVPVLGAGLTLKTGMQERLKIFVPSGSRTQAEELMNELFRAEADPETGDGE